VRGYTGSRVRGDLAGLQMLKHEKGVVQQPETKEELSKERRT